jgi:hypothetical protein
MYPDLFSKRYGLRPTPEGLMYEDVPERARVGLYHIVEQFFKDEGYSAILYSTLYRNICVALRIPRDRNVHYEYQASRAIERLVMHCEWWQFYDICDVMWQTLDSSYDREEFSTQINSLFREEQLGFEIREGKTEKVGAGFIDAKVKEARYLLKEPEFKSADELFEKSIKALNVRPKPDVENCIKDAVASVESVGKIIRKDKNAKIDNIIKDAIQKGVIPQLLGDPIIKLYAYRGNEPAIAHGGIEPSKVTVDEAEFVLAMSAAIIIYLVKKRSNL